MTANPLDNSNIAPVIASHDEHEQLQRVAQAINPQTVGSYRLISPTGEENQLPASVATLLERVVAGLARGDAVSVVPIGQELTSQQAADLLNVSRQYLVRLLDQGAMPFHRVGTHRRVRFEDLMAYKTQRDAQREQKLNDLYQLTHAFGGYDDPDEGDA